MLYRYNTRGRVLSAHTVILSLSYEGTMVEVVGINMYFWSDDNKKLSLYYSLVAREYYRSRLYSLSSRESSCTVRYS